MKSYKQLREELGLSTGAGIANPDIPLGRSKFAGANVYDVDGDTFHRCRLGKLKFKHWKKYVGEEPEGLAIREYANRNPKKSILLKHQHSGAMLYVRNAHLEYLTGKNNGKTDQK